MDDLPGVDQSSHDLAADAKSEFALHARADDAGELAIGSLNCSGRGDADKWRIGARVGGGSPAAGKCCGHGKSSG
jgi:hypothetical protein